MGWNRASWSQGDPMAFDGGIIEISIDEGAWFQVELPRASEVPLRILDSGEERRARQLLRLK